MLPPGSSLALGVMITSRRHFGHCTGYRSGSVSPLFEVVSSVHRSLPGDVPLFIANDCQIVANVRHRRLEQSAEVRALVVHRPLNKFGDRAFATAGPRLWNSLPSELRQSDVNFGQFRQRLKKFLCGQLSCRAV